MSLHQHRIKTVILPPIILSIFLGFYLASVATAAVIRENHRQRMEKDTNFQSNGRHLEGPILVAYAQCNRGDVIPTSGCQAVELKDEKDEPEAKYICSSIDQAYSTLSKMPDSNSIRKTIRLLPNSYCTDTNIGHDSFNSSNDSSASGMSIIGMGQNITLDCQQKLQKGIFMSSGGINHISGFTIRNCGSLSDQHNNEVGGAIKIMSQSQPIVVENMTFVENQQFRGGAIGIMEAKSPILIQNCTFQQNTAKIYGGAVYATSTSSFTTIAGCHLRNNEANLGGAIYIDNNENVLISKSSFNDNYAKLKGGAIHASQTSRITLEYSKFHHNQILTQEIQDPKSGISGGAIFAENSILSLHQTSFEKNHVVYSARQKDPYYDGEAASFGVRGGAIAIKWTESLNETIFSCSYCTFESNKAKSNNGASGGAVSLHVNVHQSNIISSSAESLNNNILVDVHDCLFQWNEARIAHKYSDENEDDSYDIPSNAMTNNKGGALSLQFRTINNRLQQNLQIQEIQLQSNKFKQNEAGMGGAVYIDGGGHHSLKLLNSNFISNAALSSAQYRSAGGAMALHNLATISIDESKFIENYASPSKPTDSNKGSVAAQIRRQLSWSIPTKSGDGGAIYLQKVNHGISITSSHFEKNLAIGEISPTLGPRGGAIFQAYTFSSDKDHCQSFRFKNLTFVENGSLSISSNIKNNPGASGRGGAISAHFSSLCIFSSKFENNFATFNGGDNPAFGGAVDLYNSHGEVLFNSCFICGNNIISGDSYDNFSPTKGSFFQGRGGAISVLSSSSIQLLNCNVSQNSVYDKNEYESSISLGGGLYLDGTSGGNYKGTIFSGNRAGIGHDLFSIRHKSHKSFQTNIFSACQFGESNVNSTVSSSMDTHEIDNFHIALFGGTTVFHQNTFSENAYNIFIAGPASSVTSTLIYVFLMEEDEPIQKSYLQFTQDQDFLENVGLFSYNSTIELNISGEMSLNQLYVNQGLIQTKTLSSLVVRRNARLLYSNLVSVLKLEVDIQGVLEDFEPSASEDNFIYLENINLKISGSYSWHKTKWILRAQSSITVANEASIFLYNIAKMIVNDSEGDHTAFIINGNIYHENCNGKVYISGGSLSISPSGTIHIELCESDNTVPFWKVENGNSMIRGKIDVQFSNDTLVRDGLSWLIGSFYQDYDNSIQWEINGPNGIATELRKSNETDDQLKVSLLIPEAGVDCQKMFYFGATSMDDNDKCIVCLDTKGRCVWDHISSQCAPLSSLETSSKSTHRYSVTNCCPASCNDHGKCSKNELDGLYCECELFFTGPGCENISNTGYMILLLSCVVLTFVVLGSINSMSNRRAAIVAVQSTMNDIQVGLLDYLQMSEAENGRNDEPKKQRMTYLEDNTPGLSFLPLGFIQGIRDMILLRDVCVKPEELHVKTDVLLGEGAFGVVHLGSLRGSNVAVKMVQRHFLLGMDKEELKNLKQEALLMSHMRHPNIALLMGICLPSDSNVDAQLSGTPTSFSIVTEYLNLGSLTDVLRAVRIQRDNIPVNPQLYSSRYNVDYLLEKVSEIEWNYKLILTCALQAAQGMTYLHSHIPPICHRDLKSSNLLVDDKWTIKVTDFGVSRTMAKKSNKLVHQESSREHETENHNCSPLMASSGTDIMTSNLGTTAWTAPEMFVPDSKAEYGLQVDVYSFGIVLWEMFECDLPFFGLSRFDIRDAVRNGRRPSFRDQLSCPAFYYNLYKKCVSHNPQDRPTFPDIVDQLKLELESLRSSSSI